MVFWPDHMVPAGKHMVILRHLMVSRCHLMVGKIRHVPEISELIPANKIHVLVRSLKMAISLVSQTH
jgi:hypothetical protein